MILRTKKTKKIVCVKQIVPTFFGNQGQILKIIFPTDENPEGLVKFLDQHGGWVPRTMTPEHLNLEFHGSK